MKKIIAQFLLAILILVGPFIILSLASLIGTLPSPFITKQVHEMLFGLLFLWPIPGLVLTISLVPKILDLPKPTLKMVVITLTSVLVLATLSLGFFRFRNYELNVSLRNWEDAKAAYLQYFPNEHFEIIEQNLDGTLTIALGQDEGFGYSCTVTPWYAIDANPGPGRTRCTSIELNNPAYRSLGQYYWAKNSEAISALLEKYDTIQYDYHDKDGKIHYIANDLADLKNFFNEFINIPDMGSSYKYYREYSGASLGDFQYMFVKVNELDFDGSIFKLAKENWTPHFYDCYDDYGRHTLCENYPL